MHRVSSGRVSNVKLPLFSPVSSGTSHPFNELVCDNTKCCQPGKLIQASVCPEFLLGLHYFGMIG